MSRQERIARKKPLKEPPVKRDAIRHLREAIGGIKTAMLTTVDSEGHMHSRPMATMEAEFDGELWFFSRVDSGKVNEIKGDSRVNVSYLDTKQNRYVSVSGHVDVVRDRAKIKELWTPLQRAWFPKGIDDPALVLLRIKAEQAEIWDAPLSRAIVLIQFARSVVTGRFRGEPPGRSHKIDLAA